MPTVRPHPQLRSFFEGGSPPKPLRQMGRRRPWLLDLENDPDKTRDAIAHYTADDHYASNQWIPILEFLELAGEREAALRVLGLEGEYRRTHDPACGHRARCDRRELVRAAKVGDPRALAIYRRLSWRPRQ